MWKDRQKLAVAKMAKKILLTNTPNYAKILLKSTGNRKKDEFIEVHIYGKINRESILSVRGSSKNNSEKEKVEKIKEYLRGNKKEWIEE